MNDWFEWNGVRCTEYGIHVLEQPPLTVPSERTTSTDVPGRSGSLTTLEGDDVYDDMVLTATCLIANPSRISEIAAWLKGSGTVTFANREGGFYYARVVNQIPFEKVLRGNPHRSFSVNFRCKPFWYLSGVELIVLTASTGVFINPGSIASEPVLTVYGSGDITLMIGSQMIELKGIEGSITLNTELQEAYSGMSSMNSAVDGEFPTLPPGAVPYSWEGNVSRIEIQPNWRSL